MTQKDLLTYATVLNASKELVKEAFTTKVKECEEQYAALVSDYKEFYKKFFPKEIIDFARQLKTGVWSKEIGSGFYINFTALCNRVCFSYCILPMNGTESRTRNLDIASPSFVLPLRVKASDIYDESSLLSFKSEYEFAKGLLKEMEELMPEYYEWLAKTKEEEIRATVSAVKACSFEEPVKEKARVCTITIKYEEI